MWRMVIFWLCSAKYWQLKLKIQKNNKKHPFNTQFITIIYISNLLNDKCSLKIKFQHRKVTFSKLLIQRTSIISLFSFSQKKPKNGKKFTKNTKLDVLNTKLLFIYCLAKRSLKIFVANSNLTSKNFHLNFLTHKCPNFAQFWPL